LKCAQQNCMDTALVLYCPLILEPIENNGKYGNYLMVGIKTCIIICSYLTDF
jgi:hypothetical protein